MAVIITVITAGCGRREVSVPRILLQGLHGLLLFLLHETLSELEEGTRCGECLTVALGAGWGQIGGRKALICNICHFCDVNSLPWLISGY